MSKKDALYSEPIQDVSEFVFDESVADVFDDMIRRSVPGYGAIINMIGDLAGRYAQEDSICFDLGCSLGACTLAMGRCIQSRGVRIVAVDNSKAMVQKCKTNVVRSRSTVPVDVACQDVQDVTIYDASVVVFNFTLQFIPLEERQAMLQKVYDGLKPGGVLVLSEKIAFEDPTEQAFQEELHHNFKKLNGYTDLEISQKRTALENVLIPETLAVHHDRLSAVGFSDVNTWFRCFNFASVLAFKS